MRTQPATNRLSPLRFVLAQASSKTGRGRAFALHEALDQSGAVIGPLVVAAMVAISGYRLGFGVLVIPGVATLLLLLWLRRAVPTPAAYEDTSPDSDSVPAAGFSTFTAAYGLAWLAGGTILGALYDYSIPALVTFTVITQALALLLFLPLLRR